MKSTLSSRLKVCIGAIGIPFLLNACSSGNSDSVDNLAFDPVSDQFLLGAFNLGSIAANKPRRDAVLLAARHINEAGGLFGNGTPLNVVAQIFGDTTKTINIANAMMDRGIPGLHVSWSSRSMSVAGVAAPRGVPVISGSANSTALTTFADNDFLYRTAPSSAVGANVTAQLAISKGKTRAAVLHENESFGNDYAPKFKTAFEALGGTIVATVSIPVTQNSGFGTQVTQLFANNPDVVINAMNDAGRSANFYNEAASANYTGLYILEGGTAGKQEFIDNIANPAQINGALGTSNGFGLKTDSHTIFFSQQYQAQFGLEPSSFTANEYDCVIALALAASHAGKANNTTQPTGTMIKDSLRAIFNSPGIEVGPATLSTALDAINNGTAINYRGAYAASDFDVNGDIFGQAVYDITSFNSSTLTFSTVDQLVVNIAAP